MPTMQRIEYIMYCNTALETHTGFSIPAENVCNMTILEFRTADNLDIKHI
jgi:hypothetical protein